MNLSNMALIAASAMLGAMIEDKPGEAVLLVDTLDEDEVRQTLLAAGCLVAEFVIATIALMDDPPSSVDAVKAAAAEVIRERVLDLLGSDDAPEPQ